MDGRTRIPEDAVGTEITPAGGSAADGAHRWRLWAEVDRRPYLRTACSPRAPHRDGCRCWECGSYWECGEPFGPRRGQHLDACVCWECAPDRWRGERHRRLLAHLRRKREIYDAQSSPFGIYELLPYVRNVGLEWLRPPALGPAETARSDSPVAPAPTAPRP
jgi:hypothetical protein